MSDFRYILRYYIDPGFHEEDRIAELVDFCREATIDEVMFFFNAEEMNTGHFTMEELDNWLPLACKVKTALARTGVEFSLNPWTTLVHTPRARKLKPDQDYTLMAGPEGNNNGVTACPLDAAWLKDLCALWAKAARELHPAVIWMEDDFRLHNHGKAISPGGCYCEKHLAEFSRRIGRAVSREELLAKLFASGGAHPWRRVWSELNGSAMVHAAEELRRAVTAASPGTRLGLMAGSFDSACAEGRRWDVLRTAVAGEGALPFRPHLGPYTEVWAMRRDAVNARLCCHALKGKTEILPEIESGPRHGAYSLGCGFTGQEMLECAAFGAAGMSANCYDMMGCGIAVDRRLGAEFKRMHPKLNALARLGITEDNMLGVRVLYSGASALTEPARGMGYERRSQEWGKVFSVLGISYRVTDRIEDADSPIAVNGFVLRNFSDDEIRKLLSQNVILDSLCVRDLLARGFGKYIGVECAGTWTSEEYPYSYEEIPEEDPAVYGLARPRLTAQRAMRRLSEFSLLPGAELLSSVHRPDHAYCFPGTVIFRNGLGGRVISLAYQIGDDAGDEWFYFGYFNCFRRIFWQRLLRSLGGSGAFVEEEPGRCYCAKLPSGAIVAGTLNPTSDVLPGAVIRITGKVTGPFARLTGEGTWSSEGFTVQQKEDSTVIRFQKEQPVHGGEFILQLYPGKRHVKSCTAVMEKK